MKLNTEHAQKRKCLTCGKEMLIYNSQFSIKGRGKWCSKKCRYPARREVVCPTCGKVRLLPFSIVKKGAKYCSRKCKSIDYKIIKKGENNPAWRGGITRLGHSIRTSDRYIAFRTKILVRDGGRCKECGGYKKLEIHHRKELWRILEDYLKLGNSFNPEDDYFYDESNVITLCQKCHAKLKV
jgi:endogenous inhibitor of DNA gyrase (YacG/DUF329 family)